MAVPLSGHIGDGMTIYDGDEGSDSIERSNIFRGSRRQYKLLVLASGW